MKLGQVSAEVEGNRIVKERVQEGIELLQREFGEDFVEHIDLLSLDLESTQQCVLGQLYDDADPTDEQWEYLREVNEPMVPIRDERPDGYEKGLAILDGEVAKSPHEFGFDIDEYKEGVTYPMLTAEWRERLAELIETRKAGNREG